MGAVKRPPIITLTTDFGVADGYVGTMKGVMLSIAPQAQLVDITHQIAPQNLRQTAYVLYTAYRFFSSHAVHLVVVDPGVGSPRHPIALDSSHGTFVGPDNGVFSYILAEESVNRVVQLTNPHYRLPAVSRTFHGRDIFAPGAAHLAAGVPLSELGPAVAEPVALPLPRLDVSSHCVSGEVLHTDHFGNTITSIGRLVWRGDELSLTPAFRQQDREEALFMAGSASVTVAGHEISGVRHTYADVERDEVVALVGSEGHLEIAIRQGNAAQTLGLQPGDRVELRWQG